MRMDNSTTNNVTNSYPLIATLLETRVANNERVTLSSLANDASTSVVEARKTLVGFYGDRVQFKRGRTGGITLTA